MKLQLSLESVLKSNIQLLSAIAFGEKVTYEGDSVYRFENVSIGELARLKIASRLHNVSFWSHDSIDQVKAGEFVDIHVNRDSVANFEWDMVADGIEFSLVSADLQADIEAANYGKVEGRHSLTKFNTYEEIKEWAAGLAAANDNAKIVTYGTSYEGRDLWSIEIGTGSKIVSVDCGIHAREWASPAYCQWFINELLNGKFAQYTSDIKFLVQPNVNPDGYVYTWNNDRMWRKNRQPNEGARCVGTDLNRNYEAKWSGVGASGNACAENYYGSSVFSAPESAAQRDYLTPLLASGDIKAFLTFHSYGQYILYPYSYDFTSKPSNGGELNAVGSGMKTAITAVSGRSYTMGQGTDVLYPAAGGSDDWAYDVMKNGGNSGPLSYTFELRDTGRYGFIQPANEIEPNCLEINGAMEHIIKYVIENK